MYRNNREKNKYQKVDDEDWGAPSTNHRRGEQQRRASHGEERNGGGKDATHRTRAALRRRRGYNPSLNLRKPDKRDPSSVLIAVLADVAPTWLI
uniref:Uncharacterized protein n=1 Tax=Oryza sativa subsp. japonica TaxID=39947 RepID=Q69KF6_ORYSJ|nr:hypothetical protein [Oryza sativa Japonica Group]BAD36584.1 hypothetical protein [Oryza sativa Japonica Group]